METKPQDETKRTFLQGVVSTVAAALCARTIGPLHPSQALALQGEEVNTDYQLINPLIEPGPSQSEIEKVTNNYRQIEKLLRNSPLDHVVQATLFGLESVAESGMVTKDLSDFEGSTEISFSYAHPLLNNITAKGVTTARLTEKGELSNLILTTFCPIRTNKPAEYVGHRLTIRSRGDVLVPTDFTNYEDPYFLPSLEVLTLRRPMSGEDLEKYQQIARETKKEPFATSHHVSGSQTPRGFIHADGGPYYFETYGGGVNGRWESTCTVLTLGSEDPKYNTCNIYYITDDGEKNVLQHLTSVSGLPERNRDPQEFMRYELFKLLASPQMRNALSGPKG